MQDASQQPDPLLGRVFKESYRIDRLLADGGMSRVYIAEQISLARPVVVKMLLPSFHDEDFIQLYHVLAMGSANGMAEWFHQPNNIGQRQTPLLMHNIRQRRAF